MYGVIVINQCSRICSFQNSLLFYRDSRSPRFFFLIPTRDMYQAIPRHVKYTNIQREKTARERKEEPTIMIQTSTLQTQAPLQIESLLSFHSNTNSGCHTCRNLCSHKLDTLLDLQQGRQHRSDTGSYFSESKIGNNNIINSFSSCYNLMDSLLEYFGYGFALSTNLTGTIRTPPTTTTTTSLKYGSKQSKETQTTNISKGSSLNSSIYPSSGPTQLRSSSLKDFKIACIFIAKNTTTTTTTVTPKPTIPPNQQPLPIKECSDYVDLTIDNNSDNNKTMSTPQQTSDQENTVQEDIVNEPSSDDVSDSSDSLRSLGTKRSRVPGIIPPQLPRGGLTTKLRRMRRRQLLEAVGMIPLNNTTTTTGGEGTTTSLSSVTLLPTERVIFLSDNSSASSNETSSLTMNTNTPQRRDRKSVV